MSITLAIGQRPHIITMERSPVLEKWTLLMKIRSKPCAFFQLSDFQIECPESRRALEWREHSMLTLLTYGWANFSLYFFDFFYIHSMQVFSANATIFSKEN